MAQFLEVEFPRTIGFKAMGGPNFNTTVNEGMSGFEQRNQNWSQARGKWTVSLTTPAEEIVSHQEFIDQLTGMFLVAGGKENGFRLKDHKDFTSGYSGSASQFIAVTDGVSALYQLIKTYSVGPYSYIRTIWKPVTSLVVDYQNNSLLDTVAVALGGVPQLANAGYVGGGAAQYTLDETTGQIHFIKYSKWTISSVTVSGTTATIAYTVSIGDAPTKNQSVVLAALNTGNNGTFQITSVTPTSPTAGTFTITNPSAVLENPATGTGTIFLGSLNISAAVFNSGPNTVTFTYTLGAGQAPAAGQRVTIAGMGHAGNNGSFYISGTGAGTFTVPNAAGGTETHAGTGFTDWLPISNTVLTSQYQFHYPVRFDTDELAIQLEDSNVAGGDPIIQWASIPLRELRLVTGSNG